MLSKKTYPHLIYFIKKRPYPLRSLLHHQRSSISQEPPPQQQPPLDTSPSQAPITPGKIMELMILEVIAQFPEAHPTVKKYISPAAAPMAPNITGRLIVFHARIITMHLLSERKKY